jgi:hypothetical protein
MLAHRRLDYSSILHLGRIFEHQTVDTKCPMFPLHEIAFRSVIDAKHAIASYLGQPLAKLPPEQLDSALSHM